MCGYYVQLTKAMFVSPISVELLVAPFVPATLLLGAGLLLVLAEEFPRLPHFLRHFSTRLARATFGRKAFICALMAVISVPSMLTLMMVMHDFLHFTISLEI